MDDDVLRIALPVPLPQLFDYRALPDQVVGPDWVGCRVRVPFAGRTMVGVAWEVGPARAASAKLKSVEARIDRQPVFDRELRASLARAARYYHVPLGELLATALPAELRTGRPLPAAQRQGWALTAAGRNAFTRLRAGSRPRLLAEALLDGACDSAALAERVSGWRAAVRSLLARGLVEQVMLPPASTREARPGPALNAEQAAAVEAIAAAAGGFEAVLLDGVTGSGKTEIYLHAIDACLRRGRQALVLVPEIGLAPQTLRRFRARLGVPVHVLHSGLADGERARVWAAMHGAQARVLVGTRSAVFCPLPEAGLIVVDEEHDGSYKQQEGVRYSARDLALLRGQALAVPVVLGSATPSLETLAAAQAGRYRHLRLPRRAGAARPPRVRLIDLRRQSLEGGLSPELRQALAACLAAGGQALVFRNRRGFAPALLCHDCGYCARCARCDAALTVHAGGRRLQCHHCGARQPSPSACPECGGLGLVAQGAGTERIESVLAEAFPGVPCLRVDRETTRQRDALAGHLDALGDRPGILVGTQMLAKGHHLPGLNLVCVVGVDEGLYSADFRAAERLAQLLIQVAGRAGRADRPGEVLLQTHHPEHPLLATLLAGGYPAFAAVELQTRRAAGFPPFAHLALLRAEAVGEAEVRDFLAAAHALLEVTGKPAELDALGPLPAPMTRRAGRIRWQLLLRAARRPLLHAALEPWVPALHGLKQARRVRWSLDVDPIDLY